MNNFEEFKLTKTEMKLYKFILFLSFFSESTFLSLLVLLFSLILIVLLFIFIPQPFVLITNIPIAFFIGVRVLILICPNHIFRIARANNKLDN